MTRSTMANLIVSTTNNNEPMNRAVQKVAEELPLRQARSPRGCSTTSRWRSGPTTRACPARRTRWARCRWWSSWSTTTATLLDSRSEGSDVSDVRQRPADRLRQSRAARRRSGSGPGGGRSERLDLPGVTVESDYQLAVEDAAAVAEHDVVDLRRRRTDARPQPFWLRRLEPAAEPCVQHPCVAPAAVLGLARRPVRRARPTGYVLGIRGYDVRRVRRGALAGGAGEPGRGGRLSRTASPRRLRSGNQPTTNQPSPQLAA